MTVPTEASSISFEQAIADSQALLTQMGDNPIDNVEFEQTISRLVQSEQGARGFFATFLTAEHCPLADHPTPALLTGFQSSPAIVSEILVKNLAMSAAMDVYHTQAQNLEAAAGSQRVCHRTQTLIRALGLPSFTEKLTAMNASLDGEGAYQNFLIRWGYDEQQRTAIRAAVQALLSDY